MEAQISPELKHTVDYLMFHWDQNIFEKELTTLGIRHNLSRCLGEFITELRDRNQKIDNESLCTLIKKMEDPASDIILLDIFCWWSTQESRCPQ